MYEIVSNSYGCFTYSCHCFRQLSKFSLKDYNAEKKMYRFCFRSRNNMTKYTIDVQHCLMVKHRRCEFYRLKNCSCANKRHGDLSVRDTQSSLDQIHTNQTLIVVVEEGQLETQPECFFRQSRRHLRFSFQEHRVHSSFTCCFSFVITTLFLFLLRTLLSFS